MWHVSSRSGVATLRTAIHLLLTYLLTRRGLYFRCEVLLSVCPFLSTAVQSSNVAKFSMLLPVTVLRLSSGSVVMRSVLPVLWILYSLFL